MVTKKRAKTKRKSTKRRVTRRRPTMHKMLHSKSIQIFNVHRVSDVNSSNIAWLYGPSAQGPGVTVTVDGTDLATGAGSVNNFTYFSGSCYATLNCLPDYTDLTNLFDQYRINAMELSLRPIQTIETTSTVAGNPPLSAIIYYCIDYDDSTPFAASNAGVQKMREVASFRERALFQNKPVILSCKPHIAMAAYSGGAFTDYANMSHQWIDTVSPDVAHYGVKWIIEVFAPSFAATSNVWLRPELTLSVSCKNVI